MKWDVAENELPMWVADMDFEAAPEIVEALQKRLDHKVFGYNIIPDEYYTSIQGWWKRKHHFDIEKDWIIFSTGVVPTLSSVVRKLTYPPENVLIQSPVYNIFYNSYGYYVFEYNGSLFNNGSIISYNSYFTIYLCKLSNFKSRI